MGLNPIKKISDKLKYTVLHPQWIVFKDSKKHLQYISTQVKGKVLDIGCADKFLYSLLPKSVDYFGLDYDVTAKGFYNTVPDVYGDAQLIPFKSKVIDTIVLLDVVEHLPNYDLCLAECNRVLTTEGTLIIQVPFLYPIHDAPFDFTRWTTFGLKSMFKKHGFVVNEEIIFGREIDTALLLLNLSLVKIFLNLRKKGNPLWLLIPCITPVILFNNLFVWLTSNIGGSTDFMPHSYCFILGKK